MPLYLFFLYAEPHRNLIYITRVEFPSGMCILYSIAELKPLFYSDGDFFLLAYIF